MKILSIDPGVETGYCYALVNEAHLYYFPFQAVEDVDDAWRRIEQFAPRHIIIEDFEFRGGTARRTTGLNLFPVQMIGVTRLYGLTRGQTAVHVQKAAQGKSYYTDKVLKQMECYKRGVPHGMDASRHLLHWFTFGSGYQFNTSRDRDFATMLTAWDTERG